MFPDNNVLPLDDEGRKMDEATYDCPNCGNEETLIYGRAGDLRCWNCGYDFAVWMQIVETVVLGTVGVGVDELAVWPYTGAFVDGMDPTDAAREAMLADDWVRPILMETYGNDPDEE